MRVCTGRGGEGVRERVEGGDPRSLIIDYGSFFFFAWRRMRMGRVSEIVP